MVPIIGKDRYGNKSGVHYKMVISGYRGLPENKLRRAYAKALRHEKFLGTGRMSI